MGEYLWSDKEIYKNLNFEEEIRNTDFFENFPFKKNTKEILLKKKYSSRKSLGSLLLY